MKLTGSSNSRLLIYCLVLLFLQGCTKDDNDGDIESDPFYKGAQANADLSLLYTYWSVYEVNFEGRTASVPITYGNCDRDFFKFFEQGSYKEFIIPNSLCIPNEQELQWSVDKGVIKLENSFKDFNEMVILELTDSKFLFRAKFDIDEDGKEDILQFLAKPYQPNEKYFYSNSIVQDETITNKIRLNWSAYDGINNFSRYEIYVSAENCDLSRATLLASIDEKETTFFEDSNPPVLPFFCYFLKIYTDKGLLFESYSVGISADTWNVPGVALAPPIAQNDQISLQWEPYQGLYFSYYEVIVKNYLDSYGGAAQEQVLARITDVNTTTYLDENPPILKDPVYEIRVVNKFERQNYYNSQVVISAREANYSSERVIDLKNIFNIVPSPNETVVYLNGQTVDDYNTNIIRYNYNTNTVEAISNTYTTSSSNYSMRFINSPIGQEVMILNYNGIVVFESNSLQFKYNLNSSEFRSTQDFMYVGANRYLVIDDKYAYVVQRDFSNLTILDKQEHSLGSTSYFPLKTIKIDNGRYIIGQNELPQSTIFTIDSNGMLVNKTISTIPITAKQEGETVFNTKDNTLINFNENRIYNLATFDFTSFEQPYFPKALSRDENFITGTSNDPAWNLDINSLHKKEVIRINLTTSGLSTFETEGYPHYLFENYLGQTICLSTYFKRENTNTSYDKPDFFFEIVSP